MNKADHELDKAYTRYKKKTNMSFTELKIWSLNPTSKAVRVDRSPIRTNLRLISKPKNRWNLKDVDDSNKIVSSILSIKKLKKGKKITKKLSNRDIRLLNLGFNPYK